MKILVISDIHANHLSLEAIWRRESDCQRIYCAGDIVDYGPYPHEVVAWLKEHEVQAVLGNHDKNLLDVYKKIGKNIAMIPPEEYCWVHENCKRLTMEDIEYLSSLPDILDFEADGYRYRMAHQCEKESFILPRHVAAFDSFAEGIAGPADFPIRLIFGHTHRQGIYTMIGNRIRLNPGSTFYRQPDDLDKSAHYAVIEDGMISLRSLTYDCSPILKEVEYFSENKLMKECELKSVFFACAGRTKE